LGVDPIQNRLDRTLDVEGERGCSLRRVHRIPRKARTFGDGRTQRSNYRLARQEREDPSEVDLVRATAVQEDEKRTIWGDGLRPDDASRIDGNRWFHSSISSRSLQVAHRCAARRGRVGRRQAPTAPRQASPSDSPQRTAVRCGVQISARNQLTGVISAIEDGAVMSIVVILLPGGEEVVASITKGSVDRLHLEVGQPATAIIKSTDVIIAIE
jgi:molybdopterin-binding protein